MDNEKTQEKRKVQSVQLVAQGLIDRGKLTQWKKNPSIYFLKGYRKIAVELTKTGAFVASKKYSAATEAEQEVVSQLLNELNQTSDVDTNQTTAEVDVTENGRTIKQRKTAEELKNETDQLVKEAMNSIKNYLKDPKDVIELADFMTQFHRYSMNNVALIQKQFPHATAVGGANKFKEQGFYIRKGEKAIRVLAPNVFKCFKNEVGAIQSFNKATEEQKEKIKKGLLSVDERIYFKNVPVFDISQTTAKAEDLPKIFPNRPYAYNFDKETDVNNLYESLKVYANKQDLKVIDDLNMVTQILGGAKGAFAELENGEKVLLMNPRFSTVEQIPTMIHELTHAHLHNRERKVNYSSAIKEFQAELTAYIVSKHYGLDTKDESIPYIANWTKNGESVEDKLEQIKEVKDFSAEIISKIDAELLPMNIEQTQTKSVTNLEEKKIDVSSNQTTESENDTEKPTKKIKALSFGEKITKAKQVSLIDLALKNGIDLIQDSRNQYRIADNHSVVITVNKNLFIENNGNFGGGPIDFVQKIIGINNFKDAVNHILDNEYETAQVKNESPVEEYKYNKENEVAFKRAKKYLVNDRCIDEELVTTLHEKGLLRQDKRNNLLLVWADGQKNVGCSEKGTWKESSWKKIHIGSNDKVGFNIRNGEPKNLKFFESGIDALSYMSLHKDHLKDTWFVSMEGLKPETVVNYLEVARDQTNNNVESIALCVDNDKAGNEFINRFQLMGLKQEGKELLGFTCEQPEKPIMRSQETKWDWNNELVYQTKEAVSDIKKSLVTETALEM